MRAAVELTDLMAFSDLTGFLVCYSLAVSTVTRPEDLERIAYELLIDEAAQWVRWCEPMVTPQNHAPSPTSPLGRLRDQPHPPSTDPDLGIVRRVSFLFVLLAVLVIVGIGYAALRFAGQDPLED